MNRTREKALNAFSDRFRLALNESGYQVNEQGKLGVLFGVSGQAVRKWIQAESMPSNSRAKTIADTLDIRASWLMYGEEPMRDGAKVKVAEPNSDYQIEISKQEQIIIQNLRTLPKDSRDAISELIKSLKKQTHKKE